MKEELGLILEEYHKETESIAIKVLDELKNESKDYGELKRNLGIFKRTTLYEYVNREKNEGIFPIIEKALEKEMNGLPLTNRSNK